VAAPVPVVVEVLLGDMPFWSTPVSVKVYEFFGVTKPLLLLEVEESEVVELQAGSRITNPATTMSKNNPSHFFFWLPRAPAPINARPGNASHSP
jgi:hypothetical protein